MWKYLIISLILCSNTYAQHNPTKPCSQPEARQFDFWLGEWDLDIGNGGKATNTVTYSLGDCVIVESFDASPSAPLKGMSVSVYNEQTRQWQQTWVDNQGNYLDFKGGLRDGKMVLERTTVRNGREILQRMVWYNIQKESLDWNWEKSEDGGKTWQVLWKIGYKRRHRL